MPIRPVVLGILQPRGSIRSSKVVRSQPVLLFLRASPNAWKLLGVPPPSKVSIKLSCASISGQEISVYPASY